MKNRFMELEAAGSKPIMISTINKAKKKKSKSNNNNNNNKNNNKNNINNEIKH